jgi:hypothetical protein
MSSCGQDGKRQAQDDKQNDDAGGAREGAQRGAGGRDRLAAKDHYASLEIAAGKGDPGQDQRDA